MSFFKKYKKHIFVALSVLGVILLVGLFSIFSQISENQIIVEQDEVIELDKEDDEKTSGFFGFSAGLPWYSGKLEAKVVSTEVYNDINKLNDLPTDELSFIKDKNMDTNDENYKTDFVIVNLKLKNISAVLKDPEIPDERFLINFFDPVPASEFEGGDVSNYYISECVYFNRHIDFAILKNNNYKDYFTCEETKLQKGKTFTFKLGFFVDKKTVNDNKLILNIGTSDKYKYGIRLNLQESE